MMGYPKDLMHSIIQWSVERIDHVELFILAKTSDLVEQ